MMISGESTVKQRDQNRVVHVRRARTLLLLLAVFSSVSGVEDVYPGFGGSTIGRTWNGFHGECDGCEGVFASIECVEVPHVETGVSAWCGIDDGKASGWVQCGWHMRQEWSLPKVYWEYRDKLGLDHQGSTAVPLLSDVYSVQELDDYNGEHVVLCATSLLELQVVPWGEIYTIDFCCWFSGAEQHETSTDWVPGTAYQPNYFTGIRVKDDGVWSTLTPAHQTRIGSYYVWLEEVSDGFKIYNYHR